VAKKVAFAKFSADVGFRISTPLVSWHLHIVWKLPGPLAHGSNWSPNKYIREIDGIIATFTLKGNTNIIFLNSPTSRATRVTHKLSATLVFSQFLLNIVCGAMVELQALGGARSLFFGVVAFLVCLQITKVSPAGSSSGVLSTQTSQDSKGKTKDIPASLENSNVRYSPCLGYS